MTTPFHPKAEAKHPGVIADATPEQRAALENAAALRPKQTAYVKITAYCPIETDKSDAFLDAVDAFERACRQADVDARITVAVTPMEEAQEKREAARQEKREAERRAAAPSPAR